MTAHNQSRHRNSRGQSMLETVLLMPLMLCLVFNAINMGYFMFVVVHLAGATRNAAEFSMMGPGSSVGTAYPPACSGCSGAGPDVASLLYNDLTVALPNSISASITVCSPSVIVSGTGTTNGYANCVTCTNSTTCGTSGSAGGSSSSDLDPENGTS